MDLDAATSIAIDPDAPVRSRVEALVTVVEEVAIVDGVLDERLADALDDPALVDAAIAMKKTSHICAALHMLGGAEVATTRKRVVRRLIAAGAGGVELAGLAIDIGDVQPAATIAAKDFETHIVPRIHTGAPDAIVNAWLAWLAKQPDTAAVAILRKLDLHGSVDRLLPFLTNPAHADRLQKLARSIVPS